MNTLADIRNLDVSNPIQFDLEHPVTAQKFTVMAGIGEPSYMGVPINTVWTVLDSASVYHDQCLKLLSYAAPTTPIPGKTLVLGLNQSWVVIASYDEIFADPQYYDNGSGGGSRGPKGDTGSAGSAGPMGPNGPKGDTPVIDYQSIIDTVMGMLPPPVPVVPTFDIVGPDSIVEGSNAPYVFNAHMLSTTIPLAVPLSLSGDVGAAALTSANVLSALNLPADTSVDLTGHFTFNGIPYQATKNVALLNSGLSSIALSGLAATLFEGQPGIQLQVQATYGNASTQNVTTSTVWSVVPPAAATVNSAGVLTTNLVLADTPFAVTATYTEGGVTKQDVANCINTNILSTGLAIAGVAALNEAASTTYTATVTRNNGTTGGVTSVWTCDAAIGTITAAGVFTAAAVATNTVGNVHASYTFEGVTVQATKSVTVNNVATIVYPYYGSGATSAVLNSAFVLALAHRGPNGNRLMNPMQIIDGPNISLYYAYPVSYGQAVFTDLGNNFQGGWDGAHKDSGVTPGPVTVSVTVDGVPTPFYVYQSDYPDISPASGPTNWSVT
jgi:hypothetical protein